MNQLQINKNFLLMLELISSGMEHLKNKCEKEKSQAFWYKLCLVIAASGVTLVLGLKLEPYGNSIALVLSSILTVLTTMDQFQNYTTRFIPSTRKQTAIVKLYIDLEFYLRENNEPTEEKLLEFKDRYFSILGETAESLTEVESKIKDQVQLLGNKS